VRWFAKLMKGWGWKGPHVRPRKAKAKEAVPAPTCSGEAVVPALPVWVGGAAVNGAPDLSWTASANWQGNAVPDRTIEVEFGPGEGEAAEA
jgi:hypothetical protein